MPPCTRRLAALATLLVASTAWAESPETSLDDAVQAYLGADFEAALRMLGDAELNAQQPDLLARILRQRGVVLEAMGRRLDALLAFVRAVTLDPSVELAAAQERNSAIRLFDCARAIRQAGMETPEIRARFEGQVEASDWECPLEPAAKALPKVEPAAPTPPNPSEVAHSETPAPVDEGALATWRWGFIGAGSAALIAGILIDNLLDTGDNLVLEPVDFVGASLMIIGGGGILTGWFLNPYEAPAETPGT